MHATISKTISVIFVFQESLLKLTGFIPLNDDNEASLCNEIYAVFLRCVGVTILTGTLFSVSLYIATVFWGLFGPNATPSSIGNPLIEWLTYIPYCFTNLRGFIICLLFWLYGKHWKKLKYRADELISASFSGPKARTLIVRKWRNLSVLFGLLTIVLVGAWETNSWLHYQDQDPRRNTLSFNRAVDPLPVNMTVWQYVITWTLWSTLPFCLSQQIYITVIMMAWVLHCCVCQLNDCIDQERHEFRKFITSGRLLLSDVAVRKLATDMYETVRKLRQRRMKMVTFCEELNSTYGLILFSIYGLDVFTVCGFIAGIVAHTETFASAHTLNALSVILYGTYATMFMIPMVLVHEKVFITLIVTFRRRHLSSTPMVKVFKR